jgi:hypothetical protein
VPVLLEIAEKCRPDVVDAAHSILAIENSARGDGIRRRFDRVPHLTRADLI